MAKTHFVEKNDKIFLPAGSGIYVDNFKVPNKPTSVMRVMAILSLVAGIIIAILGLRSCLDLTGLAVLVSVFVVPAFGGKAFQKHLETRK